MLLAVDIDHGWFYNLALALSSKMQILRDSALFGFGSVIIFDLNK